MGWSRQPSKFISDVLPEPEAPISATNSPASIDSETSFKTGNIHVAEVVRLVDVLQFNQSHSSKRKSKLTGMEPIASVCADVV